MLVVVAAGVSGCYLACWLVNARVRRDGAATRNVVSRSVTAGVRPEPGVLRLPPGPIEILGL